MPSRVELSYESNTRRFCQPNYYFLWPNTGTYYFYKSMTAIYFFCWKIQVRLKMYMYIYVSYYTKIKIRLEGQVYLWNLEKAWSGLIHPKINDLHIYISLFCIIKIRCCYTLHLFLLAWHWFNCLMSENFGVKKRL